MKKNLLGQFELMATLAVLGCGNDAYGTEIQQQLKETTGRTVTLGAIHRTLQRLEESGLVESRLADEESDAARRARRYFTVTGDGIRAINESRTAVGRLVSGLKPSFGVR